MSGVGTAWAIEALLASAALIALVLLIRVPVRRAFGPQVAYALWALPVLRLALPPIPASWRESVAAPIAPLAQVGEQMTVFIAPIVTDTATASSSPVSGATVAALWAMGAGAFLLWHLARYWSFKRRLLTDATETDRVGGVTIVESAAAAGPLAFGVARRFVAFPRDFAARYDVNERDLALAHELGHHARGDLIANWVALAVLALHWFNPLAWFAFRAFRADQEMANDARVLAGRSAPERHAYACAIVKSAHGGAIAAACHLHTVNALKGRLKMLRTDRTTRGRVLAGMAAVTTLTLAALGVTASGTQAAETMRDVVGVDLAQFEAPPAPPAPIAPSAPPAPWVPDDGHHRVVIVKDGKRTVYEGAAADAYVSANPVSVPPVPPVPPMPPAPDLPPIPPVPPVPPVPAEVYGRAYAAATVTQDDCGDDRGGRRGGENVVIHNGRGSARTTIICTDRIERLARAAERSGEAAARAGEAAARAGERAGALASVDAARSRRAALRSAMASMRATRSSIAHDRHMPEEARREAAADIDEAIAEMEREAANDD